MITNKSKISVVISVLNGNSGEGNITRALESILLQKSCSFEIVVVDGGSEDGTIEILKKYKSSGKIKKFLSEKDRGCCEGHNKGLKMVDGEIVYFLMADDYLVDPLVFRDVLSFWEKRQEIDVLCGDISVNSYNGKRTISVKYSPLNIKLGKVPPFLGLFIKKDVIKKMKIFPLKYNNASDYYFYAWATKRRYNFKNIPRVICNYSLNGNSAKRREKYWNEQTLICRKFFGVIWSYLERLFTRARYLRFLFGKILRGLKNGKK